MKISNSSLLERNEMKSFYGIDIVKFICAILVVSIHIAPFGNNERLSLLNYGIQNYLARLAVPFFFVTSGFFLFRKTRYDAFDVHLPIQYAIKLFRLYVIWTSIYGIFIIKDILNDEKGVIHGTLIFIRNFLFTGTYIHLWYLNASIFAVLLISLLIYKKVKIKYIFISSAILYIIGLFGQTYFGLLEPLRNNEHLWGGLRIFGKIIGTTRDGLFEAFFFTGLGMLIAYVPVHIKTKNAVCGFIISMILFFGEAIAVHHLGWIRETDMYIMLVPATFFLFYIVAHIELKSSNTYRTLRLMSSLIFYMHLWVASVVTKFLNMLNENLAETGLRFVLTVILSCICSFVVIKISNIKKCSWIKKIYS